MHKASIIEALKLSELHDGCYAVNSLNKLRLDNLTIGTEYVIVGAVKSTKSIVHNKQSYQNFYSGIPKNPLKPPFRHICLLIITTKHGSDLVGFVPFRHFI